MNLNNLIEVIKTDSEEKKVDDISIYDCGQLIDETYRTAEYSVDFEATSCQSNYTDFISKDKFYQLKINSGEEKNNFDWIIRFRSELVPEIVFQLYTAYHQRASFRLNDCSNFKRINAICEMMHLELQQKDANLYIVKNLLLALFSMIDSERKKSNTDINQKYSSNNIKFKEFLILLEEYYREPKGVEFYAEKLGMSSRNLNNICQSIIQQSVSSLIETRRLNEAKNLLMNTNKTITEISLEVGYSEKSYFTNVFKKKNCITPSEFRIKMKNISS